MTDILNKFWEAGLINKPDDLTQYFWCKTDCDQISWNGENNLEDLFNGDGETYSEAIYSEDGDVENFTIYTIGDSCGGSSQVVLDLNKRVYPDE